MHKLRARQENILLDTRDIFEKKTDIEFIKKRKRFLKHVFPKIEELYKNNPNEFEEISEALYSIMYKQEVIQLTFYLKTQDYKGLQDYKRDILELLRPKYIILEKKGSLRLCEFLIQYESLVQQWMDSENGSRAILRDINKDDGHCYIATMVYGDYNHPDVVHLRKFRDNKINKYKSGRIFIRYYYKYSPFLVKNMKNSNLVNKLLKVFIDLIVRKVKK